MRTEEQFLCGVHERAQTLRRAREKRRTAAWSAACAVLLVLLALETGSPHALGMGALTGASLLGDTVGGYVLVAVLAFMAGVAITALLKAAQKRKHSPDEVGER